MAILQWIALGVGVVLACLVAIRLWSRSRVARLARKTFGFFHPYCNAGGGGERVLWAAVHAVQSSYPEYDSVVYTGDLDATPAQILATAQDRFGIEVDASRVRFVYLKKREWVEAKHYSRFTMIGQSLGSLVLSLEAFLAFVPTVFVDTMGYAFSYPIFSLLGGCPVVCYVHYPTISTDMLEKVKTRESGFNNAGFIARSRVLSAGKLLYYRLFAAIYGFVGRFADVCIVNSSWTLNHINHLWKIKARTHVIYPPCDTKSFEQLPLQPRQPIILSLSQFRPEKNHALQVTAFAKFLAKYPQYKGKAKLVMVGGCRNAEDRARVADLVALASKLELSDKDFSVQVNVPLPELKTLLSTATVGIHTMKDEHFGIGVVEFMAAGLLTLAHNSGGPFHDIVVPFENKPTGWLAATDDEYVAALHEIFTLSDASKKQIQERARKSVSDRFSEQSFERLFIQYVQSVVRAFDR